MVAPQWPLSNDNFAMTIGEFMKLLFDKMVNLVPRMGFWAGLVAAAAPLAWQNGYWQLSIRDA
jgi:hypothetical protein